MTAWSMRKVRPEPATPPNSAFDISVDESLSYVMTEVRHQRIALRARPASRRRRCALIGQLGREPRRRDGAGRRTPQGLHGRPRRASATRRCHEDQACRRVALAPNEQGQRTTCLAFAAADIPLSERRCRARGSDPSPDQLWTLSGSAAGLARASAAQPGHRAANGQRASTGAGEPGGGGTTRLPPSYGRVM